MRTIKKSKARTNYLSADVGGWKLYDLTETCNTTPLQVSEFYLTEFQQILLLKVHVRDS
jgi:hypothetical protein